MSEQDKNIEKEMIGGIDIVELELMTKTYPRSALNIAYGQGLLVGINRAKAKYKELATAEANKRITELIADNERLRSKLAELTLGE